MGWKDVEMLTSRGDPAIGEDECFEGNEKDEGWSLNGTYGVRMLLLDGSSTC